jgi:hypothetical protein
MKDFLETDLEDIIFEHRKVIHRYGLPKFLKNTIRQLILPSGKKIDLFTFDIKDDELTFAVFELKKDKTDTQTLVQAFGYVSELMEMFYDKFAACKPAIVVVGKDVKHIPLIYFLKIPAESYSYKYGINGLEFTREDNRTEWDKSGNLKYANLLCAINFEIIQENNERIIDAYNSLKSGVPNLQLIINCCRALNMPMAKTAIFLAEKNVKIPPDMEYEDLLPFLSNQTSSPS